MMKIFSVLLFLIIFTKYTESKSLRRSYLVVKSSDEKKLLYRIQTSTSDIDTIILVDNPIVANTEGIWVDKTVNVTFSLYGYELDA
ncbi:unnamed protein product [Rotaria socialis]